MGKYFEPWTSDPHSVGVKCRRGHICGTITACGYSLALPFEKALADRIAACVTACEGIPMGRLWKWNESDNVTGAIRRAFEEGKSKGGDFFESDAYEELISGTEYDGPVEDAELEKMERKFARDHGLKPGQPSHLGPPDEEWPRNRLYYTQEEDVCPE